jgi:transposase InsO family protein
MYLRLKHDPAVLTYVTQPAPGVVVRCRSCPTRHSWPTTPDFFTLRIDRATYIETRTEERVSALLERHPGLYVPTNEPGVYACPGAAESIDPHDVGYEIRTERAIGSIATRNLRLLDPVIGGPTPAAHVIERIVRTVTHAPGITLERLARDHPVEAVLRCIAEGSIYADLDRVVLADQTHALVYRDAATAFAHGHGRRQAFAVGRGVPGPVAISRGTRIRFGDVSFTIEAALVSEIVLREAASGEVRAWPRRDIERFVREGSIVCDVSDLSDGPAFEHVEGIYRRATTDDLDEAVRRAALLGLAPDATITGRIPSDRTKRRWRQRQRDEEATSGDRLAGLVRKPRSGGGRRLHPRVEEVVTETLTERILRQNPLSIVDITRLIEAQLRVEGLGALAPCEATVRRHGKRLARHQIAAAQLGHRGSHSLAPIRPIDPDASPPNGDRSWEVGHFDATVLDIETVCPQTGRVLGRPGLSALVDGYSGMPLTWRLHYDSPSSATVLQVLRQCLEDRGRLPDELVIDQALEHHSESVQRFAVWAGVRLMYRPVAEPRFGSVVERFFLESNRGVGRLSGQTKARKHARSLDPAMDPAKAAVWDIASLGRDLAQTIDGLVDLPVIATGQSRRQRFEDGLHRFGSPTSRVFPIQSSDFVAICLPQPSHGSHRTLRPVTGFHVDYLDYLPDSPIRPEDVGERFEMRVDPADASHVFASLREGWVECRARALARLRVVSRAELAALSVAIRKRSRDTAAERRSLGWNVAAMILAGQETEASLIERLRSQALVAVPIQDLSSNASAAEATRSPTSVRTRSAPSDVDDLLSQGERAVDLRYFDPL